MAGHFAQTPHQTCFLTPPQSWSSYDRIWFSGPDKQEIFILILTTSIILLTCPSLWKMLISMLRQFAIAARSISQAFLMLSEKRRFSFSLVSGFSETTSSLSNSDWTFAKLQFLPIVYLKFKPYDSSVVCFSVCLNVCWQDMQFVLMCSIAYL
jgi:hypothetical protein